METEFIKEQVEIEVNNNPKYKYANVIKEWEKTDNKTLKFKCKTPKEKQNCYFCVRQYIKRKNKDWTVFMKVLDVYVVRA